MEENEAEAIVGNLILHGGDAKSFALEAIEAARNGNFNQADDLIVQSTDALNKAHKYQTEQIQKEIVGKRQDSVSLLMVHGQDHLMNAITIHDLAEQIVALCKQLIKPSSNDSQQKNT